jgi:molecular chaperone DnaJ
MNNTIPDLFAILGIPENATDAQIKKAWKKISMEWHPDVSKHPDAAEKFKMYAAAYEILSTPEKKAEYLEDLRKQEERELNSYSFDSMYTTLFSTPASGLQPIDGLNIDVCVEFDVSDLFNESIKKIKVKHQKQCPECLGKCYIGGKGHCDECHGRGIFYKTISTPFGKVQSLTICSRCQGHGILQTSHCNTCRSTGTIPEDVTIDIKITRQTYHNQKIKKVGHGYPGKRGGVSGDLNILYKFNDNGFQLKNGMLETRQSIQFADWLENKPVLIKLPDGKTESVSLGRFENNQTVFIPNYGMFDKNNQTFQSLSVILEIKMPKWSEAETKQILEVLNSG